MSMLHEDDDYIVERKAKTGVVLGLFAAVSAVLLVLIITFSVNKKPERKTENITAKAQTGTQEDIDNTDLSTLDEKRTSDELSFWHMYDEEENNNTFVPRTEGSDKDDKVKEEFRPEESVSADSLSENSAASRKEERDSVSGNVFDINELSESTAEFVEIIDSMPVHGRFDDAFEMNGIWKDYSLNGRTTSYHGIDVSSYQKNIDWERVAASGVDFAMLRVGSRGYGSGKVVLDEKLLDNMRGCSENAIKIGLYFNSQAVNIIEAVEEANYCVAAINGYPVEYPIVFSSESITGDSFRTEALSKEERSAVAKAFCDTVRAYGYTPMIAATKKQFALSFDLLSIAPYDFWLYDTDETSVFPYRYNMWQYSVTGNVDGIEDPVDLDISFTDYSVK
ncbi:MAG: glycoside hydrolase family 25 protein [Lachnospiraceae bacterium]|nr:glycoside hydrolase family 25 protein [Lachnospiraceae bacterium]